jgi:hypothetical protein
LCAWVQSTALGDQIVIRIPASTPHIGLVRIMASALAALLDLTYDRITDLHIAIDEVCSRIMATSDPHPDQLTATFRLDGSGLRVDVRGDAPLKPGAVVMNVWSETILRSVTDELEVGERDGVASMSFLVAKEVAAS